MHASALFLLLSISCSCAGHRSAVNGSVSTTGSAAAPEVQEQPLHEDWIQSDLKRIEQFRAVLRGPEFTVEALVESSGALEPRADVDAGFGVRRVKMHLYGGYTTIWIELLAGARAADGRSRVAELRARQIGPRDEWPRLSARYAAAWGPGVVPIENGFQFVAREEELAASLRSRTADGLGGAVRADVPEDLARAMAVLTSPFDSVVLGRQHGDGGGPPPGRAEIEALVAARRVDLLRVVLRSIDPGARVYAAWALKQTSKAELGAVDEAAIRTILAQKQELQTSEGCEQIWRSPRDAYEFLVHGG